MSVWLKDSLFMEIINSLMVQTRELFKAQRFMVKLPSAEMDIKFVVKKVTVMRIIKVEAMW